MTRKSPTAQSKLKRIRETHLSAQCNIEVINPLKTTQLAAGDMLFAAPIVVRHLSKSIKNIIIHLSNQEHILLSLDLRKTGDAPLKS